MKRSLVIGIAAAIALYGCGRGPANQQQTPPTTANTTDESMTMVGCLVPSGEAPERREVGTSGHPPPPSFTLANVSSPVKGAAARSFSLVADKGRLDDLQRFANSRVEVTGSIVASADTSDVRRLQVKDVRQLEPTCGASKTK